MTSPISVTFLRDTRRGAPWCQPRIVRVHCRYDNAQAETINGLYKTELT